MGVELANYNTHYYAMDGEEEGVVFADRKLVMHIRQALKSVSMGKQGDSNNYNELVGKLHKKFTDDPAVNEVDRVAMLVTTLKALSEVVCFIDSLHHCYLLDTVLNMRFWDYKPVVMDALVELLISLALLIYVENMLKLDVGALRELLGSGELIKAVMDYLIELDVDIIWDGTASEDPAKGIFQMELEEEEASVDAEEDGNEFPT